MKRRNFVKNISLAAASVPFMFRGMGFEAITKDLFSVPKTGEDRVLVLIRLNGGNDGLNTLIPLDQYSKLTIQRPNILIPENQLLSLTADNALHPSMTGMKNMFNDGKLSIIQNVGYPEQNRSHFRSMDIWTSGSLAQNETRGWLGRHFDNNYPNFPDDYPNATYPDPFAISLGYEVSATCQGLMGNFSHTTNNPFDSVNLPNSNSTNDGTYYGSHIEFLNMIISQTNAYGGQIQDAANAGNSLSQLYDTANNELAKQLQYVAQMISGGLKTKIYILNVSGFDTHDSQVSQTNPAQGNHANLLKKLSDAVYAFQDDMRLLGLEQRVAGMTFSEFGRQTASNASYGTDHGDAAPLFLFGGCISSAIYGPNPVISTEIIPQEGLPMQVDFRDVYASLLRDWFLADEAEIQSLFEHQVVFHNLIGACNLGINENKGTKTTTLIYPNPTTESATLKLDSNAEKVHISIYDLNGRKVLEVFEGTLTPATHHIPLQIGDLKNGSYRVIVRKNDAEESLQLIKI
ncbi:MAG: DUF1501 domain-containing protein [Crocinitomicaceae bacterium]|nr:DUF1501 domain-containing protein [Crocinitomicaceae bacterium]